MSLCGLCVHVQANSDRIKNKYIQIPEYLEYLEHKLWQRQKDAQINVLFSPSPAPKALTYSVSSIYRTRQNLKSPFDKFTLRGTSPGGEGLHVRGPHTECHI